MSAHDDTPEATTGDGPAAGGVPSSDEPVVPKAYYSIGEACELTGLKAHVLRYWETQLHALRPTKNRAGNRVYRPKEIELILLAKHLLYEEKYTIEGADQKIREMRRSGTLEEGRQDNLEPELLAAIRSELQALRDVLTPPDDTEND